MRVFISPFSQQLEEAEIFQFCESTLDVPIVATGAYLEPYSARNGELTDYSSIVGVNII